MRITQRAMAQTSLLGLNTNLAALTKLQNELTSGKTISRPSDSPTGTNTSMLVRRDLANNAQQARNITDGQSVLDSTDSALQSIYTQAQSVRALTVQALNGGAMSTSPLTAIATQVSGLRDSMLGQANQVVQGRPLFGGVTAGNQAYDPDSGTYLGVGGTNGIAVIPVNRQVSDTESIRVDTTGTEAFGDPDDGPDLFQITQNIADHAKAGDQAGLTSDLASLDAAMSQMSKTLADVGTRQARMQTAATVNSSQQLSLKATQSDTEDVDLAKTIMNMNMQQTSYQAALQTTAQVLQPTLLDFLK